MESLPLIPKSNITPNLDVTSLIREVFQNEFESHVPSKKLSENLKRNLEFKNNLKDDECEKESYHSVDYLENIKKDRYDLVSYAENVFEAYKRHENSLQELTQAELNILQTQAKYLAREKLIQANEPIQDLLKLKRQPLFADLNPNFVRNYKLLQGDVGLPPKHEANLDFRVKNYKNWKKRLESVSQDSLINGFLNKTTRKLPKIDNKKCLELKSEINFKKKEKKPRPKHGKKEKRPKTQEIFSSEPKIIFFSGFLPGEIYEIKILIKNVSSMPVKFQLKPMSSGSVFKVDFHDNETNRLLPGLTFKLRVVFSPKNLDDVIDDIVLNLQDGTEVKIPLIAYLEPPLLKTDNDLDENPKSAASKIESSYVECGNCFAGDSKVVQIRFYSYGGSGEFCIISSDDWRTKNVQSITIENIVEVPPFRVFPAYFEMREYEMIDLNVEFKPETSGTHVENIVIACNNGETRILDLLGDGIAWHSYYVTIQDSLLKDFPVDIDDDLKVKYYLLLQETIPTGKIQHSFSVSNNSNVPFDFRWEMRDAVIVSPNGDNYLKLRKSEVTIEPSSGVFQPNSVRNFVVSCTFMNAEIGSYRSVLSLYAVNLPCQCVTEANTVIRPTMHRFRFQSQSCEEEEEGTLLSPDLSMQGTYKSLQESLKSNAESQTLNSGESTSTMKPAGINRGLKKSKTYISLGESLGDDNWCCLSKSEESTQFDEFGCPIPIFDADFCGINAKGNKMTDVGDEHLWDYVDILVDEIELWAEVTPVRVGIDPPVIQICEKLKIGEPSPIQSVTITNYNSCSLSCRWSKNIHQCKKIETDFRSEPTTRTLPTNNSENYNLTQTSDCSSSNEGHRRFSHIEIIPSHCFNVSARSECTCHIRVSSSQPGPIEDAMYLTVNEGESILKLPIKAEVKERQFSVTPNRLDFQIVKTGARYKKNYVITNDSPQEMYWNVKEFHFNFREGKLEESEEAADEKHIKCDTGVLCHKGSFYTETYELQGKKPYLHCSLLKIQLNPSPNVSKPTEHYVLITADIKTPALSVVAPRFENAILAPPGMMFVGEKIKKFVTLKNLKKVCTDFRWGHPFGCHCRKLKIDIKPKEGCIKGLGKREIQIEITPLEEGITDHCYIPCFVNKNKEPIILSIVGISKNLNVTFEILEEGKTALTTLRISWPLKRCDLTAGHSHLNEADILDLKCKCSEIEEEITKAEQLKHYMLDPSAFMDTIDEKIIGIDDAAEEEESARASTTNPKLRNESFDRKSVKQSKPILPTLEEEEEDARNLIMDVPSIERRLDFAPDTVMEYPLRDPSIDFMHLVKSELEFMNVPCRTPAHRQFVIRNETPIKSQFSIAIKFFGDYKHPLAKKSIIEIKNRTMKEKKDTWHDRLIEGQPLLITATPREGLLGGHEAVPITVSVYGDTWGEYRDFVICQINGIKDFNMKVFVQIVGHPVYFPMFENNLLDIPVLRFDYIKYKSEPVSRKIRVGNRSSIPINITWMTFLKYPLDPADENDNPFNICIDMYTNRDSGEESSESSKFYITKNTAEKAPSFIMTSPNLTDSQLSGVTENSGGISPQKSKILSPTDITSSAPSKTRTEILLLANYGKFDVNVFQVSPKEMEIEPHGERKLIVTFNPSFYKQTIQHQDYKGILTGCVGIKKEYETYQDIYFRPCGKNFVSQLLHFTAVVEIPMLIFQIKKGDLKYKVNANDVLKSPNKGYSITRKFLITNKSQSAASIKIVPQPGENFRIGLVNTVRKLFTIYDPIYHVVEVEPEQSFEMELKCLVTLEDVLRAYEILEPEGRIKRSRDFLSYDSLGPEEMSYPEMLKLSEDNRAMMDEIMKKRSSKGLLKDRSRALLQDPSREPGMNFQEPSQGSRGILRETSRVVLMPERSRFLSQELCKGRSIQEPKDSLLCVNQTKLSILRQASGMMSTADLVKEGSSKKLGIIPDEDLPFKQAVFSEEISFQQLGLEQTITAKLLLCFPKIWSSVSFVDFGGVFVNDTSVKYISLTNKSGFPIDFKISQREEENAFKISPTSGLLRHTNAEVGVTITIEFVPDQPGLFKETFDIFSNPEMKFDSVELNVIGVGSWDEYYKVLSDS